ncbi:hypothetical protein [Pseudomonas aeruginosa]|uniref:hypothetical protein n=1 Tax=Pseudomonas aeruginosa TaxID=287 RepID=UPI0029C06A63|nr:hypothetical protein [Pseudomonas aeruginosa]
MSKELNKAPVEQAGGDERDLQGAQGERECGHAACKSLGEHHPFCKFVSDQDRAALAQPSPAQGEQAEGFTHFPELLESVQQMDAMLKAEAERPEVVARVVHSNPVVLDHCGPLNANDELMTVAQHAASVARWAEMFNRVEQQRDAALAEVERLRQFERICEGLPQDAIDGGWTVQGIRRYAKRLEDQLKVALARVAELEAKLVRVTELERQEPVSTEHLPMHIAYARAKREVFLGACQEDVFRFALIDLLQEFPLYAAPVAQAQHSVPEKVRTLLSRAQCEIEHLAECLENVCEDEEDFDVREDVADGRVVAADIAHMLAAAPGTEVPQAWLDVQAERRRQITAEGWTPDHDDLYCAAELPRAAAAYILSGANDEAPAIWPFVAKWWKPRDARANYVRAGALILAEIERLDRAAAPGKEGV